MFGHHGAIARRLNSTYRTFKVEATDTLALIEDVNNHIANLNEAIKALPRFQDELLQRVEELVAENGGSTHLVRFSVGDQRKKPKNK